MGGQLSTAPTGLVMLVGCVFRGLSQPGIWRGQENSTTKENTWICLGTLSFTWFLPGFPQDFCSFFPTTFPLHPGRLFPGGLGHDSIGSDWPNLQEISPVAALI